MSQGSMILKIISLPLSILLICLGVMTILGGHITPGGGFQGGAMIASGIILSVLVYGLGNSPLELSHTYVEVFESIGALGFIIFGLIGLFLGGFYLYNVGCFALSGCYQCGYYPISQYICGFKSICRIVCNSYCICRI